MTIQCPKCGTENPDTLKFCGECGTKLDLDLGPTQTLETPKEELTTGSTFAGRYQIIEELGKGGMGRVYKANDKEVNAKIAIKLIKPEIASDKKTIERFRNELKTARDISHKNVCRMYDLNKENESYYITMEYVSGEDLKSFINRAGQLTTGTAVKITKQICDGLSEAHKLGVVHRDLKSSNIMIDREGNVRIMDLGIARSLSGKGITGAGVMIGTPEYMSPEQVESKEVDQRSDIYSLGIILYEIVTERVPFEGETPFAIGFQHKSETPRNPREWNSQIPEDLSRVILKCLEKAPEKRYQSSDELRSELQNMEKGISIAESIIPKKKPLTSREITVTLGVKKLFIPAFIGIVAIIIGFIIWQLFPKKEAPLAPKIENSIAVISFENQTGERAYDYLQKAIPNLLITSLEQTGSLYVATWERLRDLLKQTGKGDAEFIDSDLGFTLCRREGIGALVLGSYVKAGDVFATDVKVLDVETKKLLKSASSRGKGADSILERQIDELSREISLSIGVSEQKLETNQKQIADVTTDSIQAYNYFLKGLEAANKFYDEEAIQFLEKAVEIHPDFAMAYLLLSSNYNDLNDTKARNEAVEKAMTLSQKTTDKEKLWIEATYARFIERDLEKYRSILQEMAEKYPREKSVHISLGNYYKSRGRGDKAIEEYNKVLELDPNHGNAFNMMAYTYLRMRNYEKAIEYFKKYVSVSPGDANPYDSLGEAYFIKGDLEKAIDSYKEALTIKPDFQLSLHNMQYLYALKEDYSGAMRLVDRSLNMTQSKGVMGTAYLWKGFYRYWLGSLENSLSDLRRAEELAEAVKDEYGLAFINWLKIWIYYDQEKYGLSLKHNENWLDSFIKQYPEYKQFYKAIYRFVLGSIEFKKGSIDSAKKRLTEMKSFFPDITTFYSKEVAKFYSNLLQSEIFLAEGDPNKAISIFEKATGLRPPGLQYTEQIIFYNTPFLKDVLARAYRQKGEIDKAISEYERLITFDPERESRFLIHPKYHYRLAGLYEEKGWGGKAIEHLEKSLDLWKDADSGIAEVENARKRLSGLKSQ